MALLLYCYASGIFSSRRIEAATHWHVSVRYVAGNTHPDHDTIASFRRQEPGAGAQELRAGAGTGAGGGVVADGNHSGRWDQAVGQRSQAAHDEPEAIGGRAAVLLGQEADELLEPKLRRPTRKSCRGRRSLPRELADRAQTTSATGGGAFGFGSDEARTGEPAAGRATTASTSREAANEGPMCRTPRA